MRLTILPAKTPAGLTGLLEKIVIHVGGIVLCGGQSKRMGRPKCWLPFGGETMLQRVVRIVGDVVQPVVVVAAAGQDVPALPDSVQMVCDEEQGRGPLQGLAGGVAALRGRCDAAYLSGCDVPFLQAAFVDRMATLLGDHVICVPRIADLYHPLAAVYRLEVLEVVRRLLAADRLRPVHLFEEVPTRIVSEDDLFDVDPSLQSLRNMNTPQAYAAALVEIDG
ncbi:MAG TPA: molybdenum cofactor guanylyltransferase [Gemmataceae bacterium]|nr:molybdenum cofactor guanylyltransferase [Gemmataceae bacterium]